MPDQLAPLPYPASTSIKVFRDDPRFDQYAKWWMIPRVEELYVCTYDLAVDDRGEYAGDWQNDSAFLRSTHPNCVFVYLEDAY